MSERRKSRVEGASMPVSREDAVRDIAAHIADRDAFVISVPPDDVPTAARRLARLTRCSWYADSGTSLVFRLSGPAIAVAGVMDMLMPATTAAVAIVPKTVPGARLGEILGAEIPEDGSRDLLILGSDDDIITWPRLMADALAAVDPKFAFQIAVNDLSGMS